MRLPNTGHRQRRVPCRRVVRAQRGDADRAAARIIAPATHPDVILLFTPHPSTGVTAIDAMYAQRSLEFRQSSVADLGGAQANARMPSCMTAMSPARAWTSDVTIRST